MIMMFKKKIETLQEKFYLLFLIIITEMMLSISFNDDLLDTSIHHLTLNQFIISLEHLLDALELSTFYDMNCRVD